MKLSKNISGIKNGRREVIQITLSQGKSNRVGP